MTDQEKQDINSLDIRKNMIRRILQVIFTVIITAVILFVSSGKIDWIYAWIYTIAYVLISITGAFILKPELIAERGRKKENTEKWDKIISLVMLIFWSALYIICGLDIRFGWSAETSLWIHLAGLVVFVLGTVVVFWAMVSNTWFSTTVRIQYDRNHSVSDSGPYRYIRHPGYLAMITYTLVMPVIFGSLWAFIPAAIMAILFIIRTHFEDSTLKTKLAGYKEYAERVKFRLIPFVW